MTSTDLIDELKEVARLAERADQGCWRTWATQLRSSPYDCADFAKSILIASFNEERTFNLSFVQVLVKLYREHASELEEMANNFRNHPQAIAASPLEDADLSAVVRANFERWAESNALDTDSYQSVWGDTVYTNPYIDSMWYGFKAAYTQAKQG